ncbi:MAG: DUF4142 domain-containing protein [Caulobacteraceae bacterium]
MKSTLLGAAGALVLASAASSLLAAPPSISSAGRVFLSNAIKGDNSEIMLGKIAERKGATNQARQFGRTLVADHTQARNEAAGDARTLGMSPPTAATPKAMAERNKLDGLSGAAFDREFARYMINDHEKAIAVFRKETKSPDGTLANLAQGSLPTLEKHLHMAQALAAGGK